MVSFFTTIATITTALLPSIHASTIIFNVIEANWPGAQPNRGQRWIPQFALEHANIGYPVPVNYRIVPDTSSSTTWVPRYRRSRGFVTIANGTYGVGVDVVKGVEGSCMVELPGMGHLPKYRHRAPQNRFHRFPSFHGTFPPTTEAVQPSSAATPPPPSPTPPPPSNGSPPSPLSQEAVGLSPKNPSPSSATSPSSVDPQTALHAPSSTHPHPFPRIFGGETYMLLPKMLEEFVNANGRLCFQGPEVTFEFVNVNVTITANDYQRDALSDPLENRVCSWSRSMGLKNESPSIVYTGPLPRPNPTTKAPSTTTKVETTGTSTDIPTATGIAITTGEAEITTEDTTTGTAADTSTAVNEYTTEDPLPLKRSRHQRPSTNPSQQFPLQISRPKRPSPKPTTTSPAAEITTSTAITESTTTIPAAKTSTATTIPDSDPKTSTPSPSHPTLKPLLQSPKPPPHLQHIFQP
ncbi:hypothetical protein BC829DRAFT_432676 [Chytridium lagenaria]|nr:hypothetical protein BC829DRAFT_432676 [Chytridium lagenaria]